MGDSRRSIYWSFWGTIATEQYSSILVHDIRLAMNINIKGRKIKDISGLRDSRRTRQRKYGLGEQTIAGPRRKRFGRSSNGSGRTGAININRNSCLTHETVG